MSALRKPANNTDAVAPFVHVGEVSRDAVRRIKDRQERALAAKRDFVPADLPAMAAVEGWRDFPATLREFG